MPAFTQTELFALHDLVRQTDKLGLEWDWEWMKRLGTALLAAEERRNELPPVGYELAMDEPQLRQVTRQVSSLYMVGQAPVGRTILLKVWTALLAVADDPETSPGETPVVAVFEQAIEDAAREAEAKEQEFEAWRKAREQQK